MTQTIEATQKRHGRKALAAGAIAAILLAGGGTYAAWQQTALAEAGQIQTGTVTVTAQEGAWSTSKTNGDIDVETYRVGSNERLVFTQDVYPKTSGAVAHLAVASIPENELRAAFPKGTWTSELSGYELSGVSDGATGVQIADGSRQPVTHQLIIETGDGVLPGTTIDLDGIQYVATATE